MTDHRFASEMPRELWSEYLERPFETCVQCESDLLADDWTGYVIQKSVVAGETVFEMAICVDCIQQLHEELSEQSVRAMSAFIREAPAHSRCDPADDAEMEQIRSLAEVSDEQLLRLEQLYQKRHERAIRFCGICGKSRDQCHRYSYGTAGLAQHMITSNPGAEDLGSPFLICEDCESAMSGCISRQTRDAWDRFVEDNFDGPPGLEVDPHELTLVF